MKCLCLLLASIALARGYAIKDNEIQTARLRTSDDLLDSVISDCFEAEAPISCLKVKVLSFLDTKVGIKSESARVLDDQHIDKVIYDRVARILNSNEFRFQLPEFLFQSAEVSYRADRGLDVEFPRAENENGEGIYAPIPTKFNTTKYKLTYSIILFSSWYLEEEAAAASSAAVKAEDESSHAHSGVHYRHQSHQGSHSQQTCHHACARIPHLQSGVEEIRLVMEYQKVI